MPGGRPSTYSDEIAEVILERIADGEFVQDICAEEGMPSQQTLLRWRAANEEFRDAYARARESQAENVAHKGFKRAWNAEDASLDRLAFDAAKWMAAKIAPRVYGDKIQQEVTGADGAAIPLMVYIPSNARDSET